MSKHFFNYFESHYQVRIINEQILNLFDKKKSKKEASLRTGFEPVRVKPNGFQVHLLNHSDTAACDS